MLPVVNCLGLLGVSDFGCSVRSVGFRVSGSGLWILGSGFRVSVLVCGFGFRVLSFGSRVSVSVRGFVFGVFVSVRGFGARVLIFGIRVPGSGFRVSRMQFSGNS